MSFPLSFAEDANDAEWLADVPECTSPYRFIEADVNDDCAKDFVLECESGPTLFPVSNAPDAPVVERKEVKKPYVRKRPRTKDVSPPGSFCWLHMESKDGASSAVEHVPLRLSDGKVGSASAMRFLLRLPKGSMTTSLREAGITEYEKQRPHGGNLLVCGTCAFSCRGQKQCLVTLEEVARVVHFHTERLRARGKDQEAEAARRRFVQFVEHVQVVRTFSTFYV